MRLASWQSEITSRIQNAWIRPPTARPGIKCVLNVGLVQGGSVTGVSIGECNGDDAVRQSIQTAVYNASPLPPPPNGIPFPTSSSSPSSRPIDRDTHETDTENGLPAADFPGGTWTWPHVPRAHRRARAIADPDHLRGDQPRTNRDRALRTGAQDGTDVAGVVQHDLVGSGRFTELPRKQDAGDADDSAADVKFADWKAAGSDYVVVGQVEPVAGGQLAVDFNLLNALTGQSIARQRFVGTSGAAQCRAPGE